MERWVLKQKIIGRIKKDQLMYGKIAYILGVSISSMPRILAANRPELTQSAIIKTLKKHWGVAQDNELMEKKQIPEKQTA